jgi:beta-phosphoglucomutase
VDGSKNQAAFIFDLDGVLIHSMPLHVLAWEEYLAGLGIQVHDLERRMHGKRNAELVDDLIGSNLPEGVVFQHGAAKEQLWRDMIIREGIEKYRIPGLIEFLEKFPKVPKAVASNAEPQNIDFVLDRYHLRNYFRVAVNGFEVARPKPFPDIYLEAAHRLGVKPQNCIVFEDSPTGLAAGLQAGMRVVGLETTSTELEGAILQIKDFTDPKLDRWLADVA